MLSTLKMSSFFLVAEALMGLIYRHPAGENSSFSSALTFDFSFAQVKCCTLQYFLMTSTKFKAISNFLIMSKLLAVVFVEICCEWKIASRNISQGRVGLFDTEARWNSRNNFFLDNAQHFDLQLSCKLRWAIIWLQDSLGWLRLDKVDYENLFLTLKG